MFVSIVNVMASSKRQINPFMISNTRGPTERPLIPCISRRCAVRDQKIHYLSAIGLKIIHAPDCLTKGTCLVSHEAQI